MPTYDYVCRACGHKFEKFESIKAEPTKLCPSCGAEQAQRQIGTGAGILFKGGGFYETDYRSQSYNDAKKKESGDAKPAEAKPAAGEPKPAPAAPATPAPAPSSSAPKE